MTDEAKEVVVTDVVEEVKLTKAEYDVFVADRAERDTLKAHHEKVAKEKKEAIAKAEREKAEAEGDLKKLLELKDNEIKERDNKLSAYETEKKEAMVQGEAMRLAQEMAKSNPGKAKLLAKELRARMQLTEDGIKVVDDSGKLVSDKLDTLKDYAQKNYDFLCDGVQSTGGAGLLAGNKSTLNPTARTMTRGQFDALSVADQGKFFRENKGNHLIE